MGKAMVGSIAAAAAGDPALALPTRASSVIFHLASMSSWLVHSQWKCVLKSPMRSAQNFPDQVKKE